MSFVTTQPEELATAAGTLQGIGSAMAAQNSAAAAATTGVIPAAADMVSALQATQFSTYGTLYQHVGAQATAIHQALVNTLQASADSYGATESANAVANGTSGSGLDGLLGMFNGSASGPYGLLPSVLSNSGSMGLTQVSNFGSAMSDLIQLGSSGFLAPGSLAASQAATVGEVSHAVPAAATGVGDVRVVAAMGQAPSVRGLSVPANWAGTAAELTATGSALPVGAGWSATAPLGAPLTALPAGMPAVASTQRGPAGFGRSRYGVRPTVMPRPAVV
ncbi:PE domain-containing protein [Mycobacterium sp. M1]|uniref:PE domain-containing protein n=1 Tax=Mycolicibacter acidiphilus TaxID=2835306 RepID=A0ABS5RPZ5_9MYCO|nr:PE domain-containing protein [Mycolicibacter acidiphilus]MBS9535674.1 PE domain-containing protein [Mycolicibacter acidiphilus]